MKRQDVVRELDKVRDVLTAAMKHHEARDTTNAQLHLASTVRYSPLTTSLATAFEGLSNLRNDLRDEGLED